MASPERLWTQAAAITPAIVVLRDNVFDLLATAPTAGNGRGLVVSRRTRLYFMLYALPLAELCGWPRKVRTDLHRSLAVHLVWCWLWRRADDVLDVYELNADSIEELIHAAVGAALFHQRQLGILSPQDSNNVLADLSLMINAARMERRKGVSVGRIWMRASPFLIVPNTQLHLSIQHSRAYKNYICAAGLVHDVRDLLDDIERGILSMPSKWLRDKENPLSLNTLEEVYRRADQTVSRLLTAVEKALPDHAEITRTILIPWLRGTILEMRA